MPSDTLSLTVGTGLGVSVLAGIISGVCFVIGYRRIHKKRETKWHCAVCNKYFRSPEFILGDAEFVICSKCEKKVCKSTCSSIKTDTSWICRTCSETTTNWIYGAFKAVEPITKVFCATMGLENDLPDEFKEDLKAEEVKKKEQVRTFIERLVNNLLEDNIDDASINEIYNDRKYLPIVGESPCSAHSALKRIIQKIIREANDLPKLKNIEPNNSLNQDNRTYEDLLSTAILNKIISSSQNNNSLNSSRANSVCSHRSSSSRRRKLQKEYFFGEETLHNKKKWRNDTDTASVSSLEEWVHSDSSRGSTKYVDRVSLTIKQRIEEVSTSDSDAVAESEENDDADYLNFKSAFGDVEPNWFLQKRQFMGSCSPVPVSMLVPDPTKEAKVFIGDKEIEDTSDLSDVPSDYEEHNDSLPSVEVSNHLIETKNLIGGKNSLADFCSSHFSDGEISADSGVKECKYMDEVDMELSTSNKDEDKFVADASNSSDGSNTERDTEYTEKYATLPRRISISPKSEELQEKPIKDTTKHIEESKQLTNDVKVENDEENTSEFTGVYSRREKEKWSHAVELKNNPYSKENIEKRIKCRNSINSLFGSDYYIRQASIPSGIKKTEEISPHVSDETDYHQSEKYQKHVIALNEAQENAPEKIEKNKLLLMAIPFNTVEYNRQITTPPQLKSSETSSKGYDLGLHFASEISSDSEVSLVNCYDVTESVVYKKVSVENEEIQSAEKYFDFESLETSLNFVDETEDQIEQLITEPIKQATYEQPVETLEIQTVNIEPELVKPIEVKHAINEDPNIPPYVISKRSDNTLIKKIYSDPSVRSFALSRRKNLPSTVEVLEFVNKPSLKYEKSSEVAKPSAMRQYSWDNRETNEKNQTKTESVKSSISMEDKKRKPQLEREPISKYEKSTELMRSSAIEKCYSTDHKGSAQINPTEAKSSKSAKLNHEIDLKKHQEETSANCDKINLDCEALEEIDKLKKQKLVANRLREISKSTFDLSSSTDRGINKMYTLNKVDKKESLDWRNEEAKENFSELQNRERSSSVRDLRKKFEKFDEDAKTEHPILHSLTGRSLSKQFKEKLRDINGDIPSLSQIHSLSLTNLEVEDNTR